MNFAVLRHRLLFSVFVFRAIFPWFKKFPVALVDPVPRGVGNVGMFRAFCRPLRGLIRVGDISSGSRLGLTSVAPPALRGPFAPLA